ncbi:hypothetical protein J8657_19620 [Dickeya oryzae]|uniref:Uncharacterized protein n=1 Tax=Dickeya oryzae TaxID=1240404 RepID=A0ABS5BH64_9GAMM|nr:hypothetical protein [Dickeya oryzae]MBP2859808.1 hypothetical protein [Dickeya oryzae]
MMTVREVVDNFSNYKEVYVNGYIIYHSDGNLSLIDKDYGSDYLKSPFLKIDNHGLSDNIENNVSLYGGGSSRLFHYAKIKWVLFLDEMEKPYLKVRELFVEDNGLWRLIDLSRHYEPRNREEINWHDIFKEDGH